MNIEMYNRLIEPPAPMVRLKIGSFADSNSIEIPALVDSGSDQTLIHQSILSQLRLQYGEMTLIESANGIAPYPSAFARFSVGDLPPVDLDVVGFDFEEHAILGRDFLNSFKLTLDGPNQTLTIE